MSFLDLFFPKHCINCKKGREYLCSSCFSHISFDVNAICVVCNKPSIDGKTHPVCKTRLSLDGTFVATNYKGVVRKLVYQLKYKPYLTDLLPLIGDLMYESCIQNELFVKLLTERPMLVPIPLSTKKHRKRGYNQAELLAKELGKRFSLEVGLLLERVKETKPQYGLKRGERIENMKGAFSLNSRSSIINSHYDVVMLVDDLLTTGSTMSEAAKLLKQQGWKEVWGMSLAKD